MDSIPKIIIEDYKNCIDFYKKKNRDERRNNNINMDDILKVFPIFLLLSFLELKKSFCYKATNKELDRVKNLIETYIKDLEFRYKGLIKREPIK